MTQTTKVLKLSSSATRQLADQLRDSLPPDADWRSPDHAWFGVKSQGVVATGYRSGKVVVQGRETDVQAFVDRFLSDASAVAPKSKSEPRNDEDALPLDVRAVGSDETGKGDYFGPLVVAGVTAETDHAAPLKELGVTDSKALSDDRARLLAGRLAELVDHEIRIVEPADYNRRHAATGNLNVLLAELHADVLDTLAARATGGAPSVAVVDRFSRGSLLRDALRARERSFDKLIEVPRAERHAGVAAASILARAAFLDGLQACADSCGTDLPKGAGPAVDAAGRRVVQIGGRELLAQVAKLHFKNSERVLR